MYGLSEVAERGGLKGPVAFGLAALAAWLSACTLRGPAGKPPARAAAAENAGTAGTPLPGDVLPGTERLALEGDIASELVERADRFLLRELERSRERRKRYWTFEGTADDARRERLESLRKELRRIVGLRDERIAPAALEYLATTNAPSLVGTGEGFAAHAVRWPALDGVHGEGLLLVPLGREPLGNIVAIPDASQTPEEIAGLSGGVPATSQYARRLAESGFRVLVPVVIDRANDLYARHPYWRKVQLTHREFLYRPAFELGRHLIGYELAKVLSAIDWFKTEAPDLPAGVAGWGEGGLLALYAAALDERIDAALVSGCIGDRRGMWREPIDRNVFGLLERFGDAELIALAAPRAVVVEAAQAPEVEIPPGTGGAPARIETPPYETVAAEVERARALAAEIAAGAKIELVQSGDGTGPCGSEDALRAFVSALSPEAVPAPPGAPPKHLRRTFDPRERLFRQMVEIERHTQRLLRESAYVRRRFFSKLDVTSLDAFKRTVESYRRYFRDEVIGRFEYPLLPPRPRTRRAYEGEGWTGYEVVLDVFEDVIAYGVLLLPHGIPKGERRPVVVCQHGLEGRPEHVIRGDHPAYHDFAARLAQRGFITFAPQNLYIFGDRFRTLQRKANPLKKTLFSIIVPQHQAIVAWLKTLPWVDQDRIAFYGLSYGGKTAMRVPPLVPDYKAVICSADFNEWVWKNASTRSPYSYVWTGEYEIFEFDLGSTFNYAEMAALIAPRPFMVERGHFDGVAPDETVAYEYAKVRFLYAAQLGIGDRTEIEFFRGPHTINGKGTFRFLHRHLGYPEPPQAR